MLTRRVAGPLAATSAAIAFVAVSAFPQTIYVSIFNFVLPFNFSATYGMTAAIWSTWSLVAFAETRRTGFLVGSVLLLGLCALTKSEIVLAAGAPHVVLLLATGKRLGWRGALTYLLGAALPAAVYAAIWLAAGGSLWANLSALATPASRTYISRSMGLGGGTGTLQDLGLSLVGFLTILGATLVAARGAARSASGLARGAWLAGVAVLALLVTGYWMPEVILRALPIVLAVGVMGIVTLRWRNLEPGNPGTWLGHLLVWTFALAALPRIIFQVGTEHYGFVLTAPALAALAVGIFESGPRWAGDAPATRAVFGAAGVGVFAGITLAVLRASMPFYTEPRAVLQTARVDLRVDPGGAELPVVNALARLPSGSRAIAVPQGEGLLFAAGISGVRDGFTSYLPMEIPDDAADARLVASWEADPPDAILYWVQDLRPDFGFEGFGADYGRKAFQWIQRNYVVAERPVPGMFVLVRRR
jgi:hypothetical protein